MNTDHLLKVINEIIKAEKNYDFQNKINSILTFIQQNNPDEINKLRQSIEEGISQSPSSNYVNIDVKVLKYLEVYGYFDPTLIDEINSILGSQSHEVQQKLQQFIQKRGELLQRLRELSNGFQHLGITSKKISDDVYLVNLSLPEKYHDLEDLQESLKNINLFLATLARSTKKTDVEGKMYEIKSVGNGCIEFFIQVIPELAEKVVEVLDIILRVKGAIEIYKSTNTLISNYSNKKNAKDAEKIAKKELEDAKKSLIEEYVSKLSFDGDKANVNDEKNRARNLLKIIVKYFEEGISIEVKTPLIEQPKEPDEGDSPERKQELKVQKKEFEQKKKVDEINKKIYELQQEKIVLNLPEPEKDENDEIAS